MGSILDAIKNIVSPPQSAGRGHIRVLYCDTCWEYKSHRVIWDEKYNVWILYCPKCQETTSKNPVYDELSFGDLQPKLEVTEDGRL